MKISCSTDLSIKKSFITFEADQMPYSATSDLGLHRLLRPVGSNSSSKYHNLIEMGRGYSPIYASVLYIKGTLAISVDPD